MISSSFMVPYRDSRLCYGATFPVLLVNCHGGSARMVAKRRPAAKLMRSPPLSTLPCKLARAGRRRVATISAPPPRPVVGIAVLRLSSFPKDEDNAIRSRRRQAADESFPVWPAGVLPACFASALPCAFRRTGGRLGGLLGLAQRPQPGGLFALGDQASLVVRHGFGGFPGLDFLFPELEFRPFPGLFPRCSQCCFLFTLENERILTT